MTWDPATYLAHASLRLRPAGELLARIPLNTAERVYDMGCGTGNSTALLRSRWPKAQITGVDNSTEMLTQARQSGLDADWQETDLGAFFPSDSPQLIFSNAAYHWIDNHQAVFARLAESLADRSVLAVQMPANFDAPSHTLLKEVAADGPWADDVADLRPASPVHDATTYYGYLAGHFHTLDIWYTEYLQILDGTDAVFGWVKGTALTPYVERLQGQLRDSFVTTYAAKLRAAYPMRADGTTLFPFRRLFIVGQRP